MFELVTPGEGPVLTPGASFEHILQKFTWRCYTPNIKALRLLDSEEKIFKDFASFPFGCHGNHLWMELNSLNNFEQLELHPWIIPVMFHQDWPSGLGDDVSTNS